MRTPEKPGRIEWVGSARDDLRAMPEEVRADVGMALFEVQCGETPSSAKPLKGIGPGVLEIVSDLKGDTFRAVYVARFEMQSTSSTHSRRSPSKASRRHGTRSIQSSGGSSWWSMRGPDGRKQSRRDE